MLEEGTTRVACLAVFVATMLPEQAGRCVLLEGLEGAGGNIRLIPGVPKGTLWDRRCSAFPWGPA